MGLFSGTRPDNLGVRDARLAPPKRTPNNVNSQIDRNADPVHYIEPLRYSGDAGQAWAALRRIVDRMKRVTVVKSEPNYLYAEAGSLPAPALEQVITQAKGIDMAAVHREIAERGAEA